MTISSINVSARYTTDACPEVKGSNVPGNMARVIVIFSVIFNGGKDNRFL